MARRIVLDCCALVHAKAMQRLPSPPLQLLYDLAQDCGYTYLTSKKVYGELGQSTLSTTLNALPADSLDLETARRDEVKQLARALRRGMKEPGDHDKELIALASRYSLPLLTHDVAAARLAERAEVEVLDLVDLAMHACWEEVVDAQTLHDAWGDLQGFPWPWPNYPWDGSLLDTFIARYT